MNEAEGSADCITQEQSSIEGRAELNVMADNPFFTFIHFLYFILHESAFFFWEQ